MDLTLVQVQIVRMPATLLTVAMTWEAEMNQLSQFQHLEKMVKLIAMHVGLGQDSNPICSDSDDGSNPNWPPDDNQNNDDLQESFLNLYHLRNEGKLMISYALRTTAAWPGEIVYFSTLQTLSWTCSMLMIVLQNM